MKVSHNPILGLYVLEIGGVRICFSSVADGIQVGSVRLANRRVHVATIDAIDAPEFKHELRMSEAARAAREMAQNSAEIHGQRRAQA
jgi:hypothetical protein